MPAEFRSFVQPLVALGCGLLATTTFAIEPVLLPRRTDPYYPPAPPPPEVNADTGLPESWYTQGPAPFFGNPYVGWPSVGWGYGYGFGGYPRGFYGYGPYGWRYGATFYGPFAGFYGPAQATPGYRTYGPYLPRTSVVVPQGIDAAPAGERILPGQLPADATIQRMETPPPLPAIPASP